MSFFPEGYENSRHWPRWPSGKAREGRGSEKIAKGRFGRNIGKNNKYRG